MASKRFVAWGAHLTVDVNHCVADLSRIQSVCARPVQALTARCEIIQQSQLMNALADETQESRKGLAESNCRALLASA